MPAAGIQQLLGTGATLFYGAVFFVAAAVLATRLPQAHANRLASEPLTERGVKSSDVHVGWIAMTVLRICSRIHLVSGCALVSVERRITAVARSCGRT